MLRKPIVIVLAFVISVVGILVYFYFGLSPDDVQPMGAESDTVSWVALGTAVVSMLTAIFGLAQKISELKGKNRK
mgnify:CR=1 FL=1